jgi:hypothetical protein
MTSVIDIENAVKSLPPDGLREFSEWFLEYQAAIESSEGLATFYDQEEGVGGQLLDGTDG